MSGGTEVEIENLEIEEIQQQLEKLNQNRSELEQALVQRHQQAKLDLVQEIKDLIQNKRFESDEIVPLLGPRGPRRRRTKTDDGQRQYTKYVDPDNPENTYVRGVIPGWMKQKMQDQGYDPGSKLDREAFKANCLHVLED